MTRSAPLKLNLQPVGADRPATYALSISIHGQAQWPFAHDGTAAIEIQLDDLLAHLVEFWRPLLLRQNYPIGFKPMRPSLLMQEASERWKNEPQDRVDEEAEILSAFEDAHDVSRAFAGMFDLPHFWMLREGDRMICDTGRELWRLPFETVIEELAATGDWIADLLLGLAPKKWDRIVDAWRHREEIGDVDLVAWSAGLDVETARQLINRGAIVAPANLRKAANDDDPLLIAARMAGELPVDQIVGIIEVARSFVGHRSPKLDELSAFCLDVVNQMPRSTRAHSQGEAIARQLRQRLEIAPHERADVFAIAGDLAVEILSDRVEPSTFDGLAIAGGGFGPGAFINQASRRLGNDPGDLGANQGARVTLAHELCHLLIDRGHPLSAIEVLRNRMPAMVEARARAFAGEFLLPTAAAVQVWQTAGSPTNLDRLEIVLQDLADRFGVTFSVAAWKVEHGAGPKRHLFKAALDTLAPYR